MRSLSTGGVKFGDAGTERMHSPDAEEVEEWEGEQRSSSVLHVLRLGCWSTRDRSAGRRGCVRESQRSGNDLFADSYVGVGGGETVGNGE